MNVYAFQVFSEVRAALDKNWKEMHHGRLCEILANVERECNVEIFFVEGAYQFRGTLNAVFEVSEKLRRESNSVLEVLCESSGDDDQMRAQQHGELSADEDTRQVEETESLPPAPPAGHVNSEQSANPLHSASDAPLAGGCDSIHREIDEHCHSGQRSDQRENTTPPPSISQPSPRATEQNVQPQKNCQASDKDAGTKDETTNASEKPDSQRPQQQTGTTDGSECTESETHEQGGEKASHLNIQNSVATSAHKHTDDCAVLSQSCTMTTSHTASFSEDIGSSRGRSPPTKIRKDLIYARESEMT